VEHGVPETRQIGEMSSDDAEALLIELKGLRTTVNELRATLEKGAHRTKQMIATVVAAIVLVAGFGAGAIIYTNHRISQNNAFSCVTYRDLQKLRPDLQSLVGKGILNDFGALYEKYNCKPPLSEVLKQIEQEQANK
jgi:hypothetical protein